MRVLIVVLLFLIQNIASAEWLKSCGIPQKVITWASGTDLYGVRFIMSDSTK